MKTITDKFTIFISLLIPSMLAYSQGNDQTTEFRHFARMFFLDQTYQIEHIQFPLPVVTHRESPSGHETTESNSAKESWEHIPEPDNFYLDYDIVIYDNFERKQQESNERVLSYECVSNNGNIKTCTINNFYFKKIGNQWYLLKLEEYY